MREILNVYGNLIVDLESNILLGKPRLKCKDHIRMCLQGIVYEVGYTESIPVL
jgi:hypothetical protein